jgi:hypothetical protein
MIAAKSPRSSISSVPTESFDYDTSNSISESEDESYNESKLHTPASILNKRSSVGSKGNRRSSITSNRSLGSTLPLEDSMMDESINYEDGFESNSSSVLSVKSNNKNIKNKKASSPFSLEESPVRVTSPLDNDEYPPETSVENELFSPLNKKNNKNKNNAPSSSSSRDGAKGRMGYNNIEDNDDDNADFGDDFDFGGDDNMYNDDDNMSNDDDNNNIQSSLKRTPKSASSSKTSDSAGNRRVSFGKDTKKTSASSHKTPQSRRSSFTSDVPTPDSINSRYSIGNCFYIIFNHYVYNFLLYKMFISLSLYINIIIGTTPGSNEFQRGREIVDETFTGGDNDDDVLTDSDLDSDEGVTDKSGFTDDMSFLDDKKKRSRDGGSYSESSSEDDISDDEDTDGLRRSRRATKGKKFAFWKNERPIYERGKMVGELHADPTPKKKVIKKKLIKNNSNKAKFKQMKDSDDDEMIETSHSINLPAKFKYVNSNEGGFRDVWDDVNNKENSMKVFCYSENRKFHDLPKTVERPPGKDTLSMATSTFTNQEIPGIMSAWTSGVIELPSGAIKDAEGVGECSQVFFIADCQDSAIELGIASPKELTWNDKSAIRQVIS